MVEKMTLIEKVNLTTGVGWQMGLCVGNTGWFNPSCTSYHSKSYSSILCLLVLPAL